VISGVGRERGSCPYGRQPASLRLSPAQPGDFAIVSIFWPYGFFLGGDRSCNGTRPDHSKNRIRNGVVDSQTAKGDTMWLAIIQPAAAAAVARNGEGPPTDATDIKPPQTRFRGRSQALLIQSLATAPLVGPGSSMRRGKAPPSASMPKDRRGTCARRVTSHLPRCCMTSFCVPQPIKWRGTLDNNRDQRRGLLSLGARLAYAVIAANQIFESLPRQFATKTLCVPMSCLRRGCERHP